MDFLIGVGVFIGTILLMVVLHEFGHYITARRFGIRVEEFFVGFGPRLFSRWRGDTEFGIKLLPLGGYVKIAGMNPFQEISEQERPRSFGAKPAWQRAIVLLAGSFTHFVLATVVFSVLIGVVGIRGLSTELQQVASTVGGRPGPALVAGLKPGDRVVAISGRPVRSWEQVRQVVRPSAGKQLVFEVLRSGRRLRIPVTPVQTRVEDPQSPGAAQKVGQIGISTRIIVVKKGPLWALGQGLRATYEAIGTSVTGVGEIFSLDGLGKVFGSMAGTGNRQLSEEQPIGLVGTARLAGQATSAGAIESLVSFLAYLIVFIGVINLAPLPPLDGGHLLVLGIEKISRRKIDARKIVPVAGVVLGFLVILTVALLYLDVARPVTDPFQ